VIIAMTTNASLLLLWAIVAALGVAGASAVLVWAVRGRQFSDQDRARYLPFLGHPPNEADPARTPPQPSEDRHVSH
jgi:nitrogen fixation-related uncharacterized protein